MGNGKMRFLFLVQGEGRGHMSQALALNEILTRNGDEVVYTFIGSSSRRAVPGYFFREISSEVRAIRSPNFILDKKNKSLRLYKSIFHNSRFLKTYYQSLQAIDEAVQKYRPDGLVNFYDFLGGFYFRLFRPPTRHIVIGHAFLAGHPEFPLAKGRTPEKWLFKTNNFLTAWGSVKRMALSLRPLQPPAMGKTIVTPPLIREKLKETRTAREPFILAYMVNDGYAEELLAWHKDNPETVIHCFWDRKGYNRLYRPHPNLTFHPIDENEFRDHLSRCSGYATTAGFESVAEALYLGKPVMVVPVAGQYEQASNALDAMLAGPVIKADKFDLTPLIRFIEKAPKPPVNFRTWADQTAEIMLRELHNLQP